MKVNASIFKNMSDTEAALVIDSDGEKQTIGGINACNGTCGCCVGDKEYELIKVIDLETMEA